MHLRAAAPPDAAACAGIYAPYVTDTVISFEDVPPDAGQMAARIDASPAWLVATEDDAVVGYAYAGPFSGRAAYRWSCETSVYVDRSRHRAGVGAALYRALFTRLAAVGYRTVAAGMTLPNDASAGLHRALGFEPVGVYRGIGWKFGAWHDVAWVQRAL